MTTVSFDGRMGASGDMLLGALLDAGADRAVLAPIEAAIDVSFDVERVVTHGIAARKVTVGSGANAAAGSGPHRHYEEVVEIVRAMDLERDVERRALAAFQLLGEAEAAVHGASLADTHFHEVGADDAIADVTGVMALLGDIDPEHVVTGPLSTGDGEVTTGHGVYPIPPPAVVEIAGRSSLTLRGGPVDRELLTPTGAAILGTIAEGVETLPPMRIADSGYGVGDHEFESRPNVLRAMIGPSTGRLRREEIRVLETNLDDTTPEILGHLQDRLREAGALDVACVPMTMKKSRPGHLITVVVQPADAERIARTLAAETGTLGVRSSGVSHRWTAKRELRTVEIDIDGETFEVDVKVASDTEGEILDRSAEFDDAAAVARVVERPVREIMRLAEAAAADLDPTGKG